MDQSLVNNGQDNLDSNHFYIIYLANGKSVKVQANNYSLAGGYIQLLLGTLVVAIMPTTGVLAVVSETRIGLSSD